MPQAIWPTPTGLQQPMSSYQPPTSGLAGFFGNPDLGAEMSDRLGIVAEILSGIGTGRGLSGISRDIGAANDRSLARQQYRRTFAMVNRAADKIEQSNPDLAAMMRANPQFGMEVLGKQALLPLETEQELKINKAKGDQEYQRAIDLEREKARLKEEYGKTVWANLVGLPGKVNAATQAPVTPAPDLTTPTDTTGQTTTQIPAAPGQDSPIAATPIPKIDPASIEQPLKTTPPVVAPAQPAPPAADPYMQGLSADPAVARDQLALRRRFEDPDLPAEAVQGFRFSINDPQQSGLPKLMEDVTKRKEARARLAALQDRPLAAGEQGPVDRPANQILRHAGLDPASEVNPKLTANILTTAAQTGSKEYQDALEKIAKGDEGMTVYGPDGQIILQTGGKGNKGTTQSQAQADALYLRGKESILPLEDPKTVNAMTAWKGPIIGTLAPDLIANAMYPPEYRLALVHAHNFLTTILRRDSQATVTPAETREYGGIFLPQPGDDPATIDARARLRRAALEGVRQGMSAAQIWQTAKDNLGPDALKSAIPPMTETAKRLGVTQEKWDASDPEHWDALRDPESKKESP